MALRYEGFTVKTAATGRAALTAVTQFSPALVILDVMLPDIAGRVLTRSQILDHVWHYDFGGDASVLETYISYLRRKVDRIKPPLIQTVRGVGYVLRAPRT